MRKRGVLQFTLQLNFWVASDTCNSLYLYVMSAIGQVTRVARIATHRIYSATHYNFVIIILFQVLCKSPMITIIMSCWHHFSSIHQNLICGILFYFSWFFWNIDIHCPLWLFVLDGLGLWRVAQSKVAKWHSNWILETNIYMYLGRLVHNHK